MPWAVRPETLFGGIFPTCRKYIGGKAMLDFSQHPEFEAVKSEYNGHVRYDFKVLGKDAIIVFPDNFVPKNKWVWRAEFFDAFPIVDIDLLEQGWALTYIGISDMYGNDESVEIMRQYQEFLVDAFDLEPKATIFGFSRGGVYAVNYAAKYPQNVGCLYLDAPVLDILSWPAGRGKSFGGQGTPADWEICKKVLGLTEETAADYKGSPKYHIAELAKADIPLILVQGDADIAAPMEENAQLLIDNYEKLGGTKFKAIIMPGKGHHPHSVEDPKPVSDFIKAAYEK